MPDSADFNTRVGAVVPGMVCVVGVPFDDNVSMLRGPAQGPDHIRLAFGNASSNTSTESGIDLESSTTWVDLGDLPFGRDAFADIERHVGNILKRGASVITLGGDHSITYPVIRAHARAHDRLNIVQFDAHPDLYDEFAGSIHSHACPFARIMEEDLVHRLVQVGIRTMTEHQRHQAERFGVEVIPMRHVDRCNELRFDGPVYISVDLDCLDPAFAPGVSHPEPGGLSTRWLVAQMQNLRGHVVGADIVELNPLRDPSGLTAMVAAKLLKELLDRVMSSYST